MLVNNFSFLACENLCWDEDFLFNEYLRLCHWDQAKPNNNSRTDDEKEIKEYIERGKRNGLSSLENFLLEKKHVSNTSLDIPIDSNEELLTGFRKEIEDLVKLQMRGPMLEKLYNLWNKIIGSTALVERVFSIAGNFFSVRRRRMSCKVLDSLVVLNHFYREEDNEEKLNRS